MLFRKQRFPVEGECVFCTVTKVQYNSVFANLDEYDHKHGMIHISEISPGRIRNINDYVKEGKVIICKILRINRDRGHIDLSLRRVNESQRRAKIEERKQQAIAENIIKSYAQLNKLELKPIFEVIASVILGHATSMYAAFESVVEDGVSLVDYNLDKKLAEELEVLIKERIKLKQVEIEATIKLTSYAENGVDDINKLVLELDKVSDLLKTQFLGAGKYKIEITAANYVLAEKVVSDIETLLEKTTDIDSVFERD